MEAPWLAVNATQVNLGGQGRTAEGRPLPGQETKIIKDGKPQQKGISGAGLHQEANVWVQTGPWISCRHSGWKC